jgi:heme-degrading monooxygenase HmoA
VTVAEWESEDHFGAALRTDEFRELDSALADIPHYPGRYEVIRT